MATSKRNGRIFIFSRSEKIHIINETLSSRGNEAIGKLSVSNIVWGNEKFDDFLKLLKQEGCHGIELAPSLIWNEPINSSREERQVFVFQIYNSGLEFVGFHSLLFSRPDLQLFKDDDL